MKKIFSLCILILTLCLGSTVFGSYRWGVVDVEEFLKSFGYNINFKTATYTDSNYSYNKFSQYISATDMPLIIFDMKNGGELIDNSQKAYDFSSDIDFVIYHASTSDSKIRRLELSNLTGKGYYYYCKYSSYCFAVDVDANTVRFMNNIYYTNDNWVESNLGVSHEEFISTTFQEYLLKYHGLMFAECNIYARDSSTILFNTQGGRITSSTWDNVNYKGSISYGNSTKTINLTYTNGFDSNSSYDLFLERYQLDNNSSTGYGIGYYPLETINLGTVTTSNTSLSIDINEFLALGSNNVYRLCVGSNNFDSTGSNDVYICTDWLLPNSNTLRKFPIFAQSHYYQFLNLVAFDDNYEDNENNSGDVGGESSGDNNGGSLNSGDDDNLFYLNYPKIIEYPLGVWNGEPLNYKAFYKFKEYDVEVSSCWMHFDKYQIISGDLVYINSLKFNPFTNDNYNFDTYNYEFNALDFDSNNFFDSTGVFVYFPYLRSNWGQGLYPEYSYKITYFFTPSARLALTGENPEDYFDNIDYDYPQFNTDDNDFNSLISNTTAWVSNIFNFLYIFPPWLINCIISAISIVVVCRILGR